MISLLGARDGRTRSAVGVYSRLSKHGAYQDGGRKTGRRQAGRPVERAEFPPAVRDSHQCVVKSNRARGRILVSGRALRLRNRAAPHGSRVLDRFQFGVACPRWPHTHADVRGRQVRSGQARRFQPHELEPMICKQATSSAVSR